uniref:Transmembrane protein n=1 Tax=Wuchereria bancrofti TaxID=6293 RepID=A0AAF5Q105_WUCBA
MSFAISIIIMFCSSSIQCFQDVKDEKSSEDQNDHWLLLSGIGQNDCKGDENEWIKPTVIGYLVGQFIGAIFGIALCVAFIYHCILKNLKFLS